MASSIGGSDQDRHAHEPSGNPIGTGTRKQSSLPCDKYKTAGDDEPSTDPSNKKSTTQIRPDKQCTANGYPVKQATQDLVDRNPDLEDEYPNENHAIPDHEETNTDFEDEDQNGNHPNPKRPKQEGRGLLFCDVCLKLVNIVLIAILLLVCSATFLFYFRDVPIVNEFFQENPWLRDNMIGNDLDVKSVEPNVTTPVLLEESEIVMVEDNLKQALYSVKISMKDANEVQRHLEGELFSKWDESCKVTKSKGVDIDNLDNFLDRMAVAYKFDNEVRDKMSLIKDASGWTEQLIEFKYQQQRDNSGAKYGMIALGKYANGQKVDMAFVEYKMNFKLAPETVITETENSYLWGLITWKGPQSISERERLLSASAINKMHNFFRFKAMKGFYEEGVIDTIQYTDAHDTSQDDKN